MSDVWKRRAYFSRISSAKRDLLYLTRKSESQPTWVRQKTPNPHLAKEGDVMGYRATLSGDIYSCSATALEKSSICFIPKEVFISLVSSNSKLAF